MSTGPLDLLNRFLLRFVCVWHPKITIYEHQLHYLRTMKMVALKWVEKLNWSGTPSGKQPMLSCILLGESLAGIRQESSKCKERKENITNLSA